MSTSLCQCSISCAASAITFSHRSADITPSDVKAGHLMISVNHIKSPPDSFCNFCSCFSSCAEGLFRLILTRPIALPCQRSVTYWPAAQFQPQPAAANLHARMPSPDQSNWPSCCIVRSVTCQLTTLPSASWPFMRLCLSNRPVTRAR